MLSVIAAASRVARADMRTLYSPATWTFGWLGRILAQVIFFALIGLLLEDPDAVVFLFIGQAVMVTVVEVFFTVASTTWEKKAGTLPLILASPASLWAVLFGRSLQWVPSGVATASAALFVLGPALGIGWSIGAALLAVPVLILVSLSMYAVALTLAAAALRTPGWRNVLGNVGHLGIMLGCGVVVPVTAWPAGVQLLVQAVPLTHGLEVIRALQTSGPSAELLAPVALLLTTGLGWAAVAAAAFSLFASVGRRDGSIAFSE